MKLNIYNISHPIIQLLSSKIQNTRLETYTKHYSLSQLGYFLIYETIRDWVKIYKLKIKQINRIKEIIVPNPNECYIILTNITSSLDLIYKAKDILPNCDISFINFNKKMQSSCNGSNFSYIPEHITPDTKFIIMNHYLKTDHIIKIVDYLTTIKKININQIRLTSIICENAELVKISKQYPQLSIYTTQIKNFTDTY